MNLKFKLGKVQVAGIAVEGIEIKVNYSLEETVGVYDLVKKAIKESVETMEDLKAGALKFREINKEFNILDKEDLKEYEAEKYEEYKADQEYKLAMKLQMEKVVQDIKTDQEYNDSIKKTMKQIHLDLINKTED